jgi:hypothetical protein
MERLAGDATIVQKELLNTYLLDRGPPAPGAPGQ